MKEKKLLMSEKLSLPVSWKITRYTKHKYFVPPSFLNTIIIFGRSLFLEYFYFGM